MVNLNNESINRLEKLLEESELPWWEWNVKNDRVRTNGIKEKMLGYDPNNFKNSGYEAYTDLLHKEDYDRAMKAMQDCLDGKKPIYQVDYRIKRADGQYTWYMDRGKIIEYDNDGKPLLFRGLVIDLGEEIKQNIKTNVVREKKVKQTLDKSGCKVITICECKLKNKKAF